MKNISLTCRKINKIAMNAIRPLGLLIAIIISLSMFSCKPAEEPAVVPGKPSLTDLSGELSEEERCGAIRFKVSVPEADAAWIKVSRPDGRFVYENDLQPSASETIDVPGLSSETVYSVTATAANRNPSSDAAELLTASATIEIRTVAPEYLTLGEVTDRSYSFRIYSQAENGFWFSSGEYDALEYLVPGWSTDDRDSMLELLEYLWPFEGYGDMTIECVNGEQPEWAEIPIDVLPQTRYFIIAADKDADGNVIDEVHFLDFYTL